MMTKLTAKKVENAKPGSKEYKLHDGEGLFLRVRPSGAKSWLFSFSLPGDRTLIRMTLGSTRGIYVAAQHNHVAPFLQKINKFESPIGVLIFEAIIFTAVSGVFLLFSQVASTFWLLLVLASQLSLIYYFILFLSAIRLRYLPVETPGFLIPGGKLAIWALMGLGACTSLISLCIGFISPSNLNNHEIFLFHLVMSAGLIISISLPFLFFIFKDKNKSI